MSECKHECERECIIVSHWWKEENVIISNDVIKLQTDFIYCNVGETFFRLIARVIQNAHRTTGTITPLGRFLRHLIHLYNKRRQQIPAANTESLPQGRFEVMRSRPADPRADLRGLCCFISWFGTTVCGYDVLCKSPRNNSSYH